MDPVPTDSPAPLPERLTAWAVLREAVRGSQRDLTQGPIGRAIVLLAVPMVLEMLMESLFAIVDVFWVSRLGGDAVAGVGLTESALSIVYALAMGIAFAASATVSRRVGEKDADGASRAAVQTLVLGLCISLPIALGGAPFAAAILRAMGGSPSVVRVATPYTAITLASNAVIMTLFLGNAVFRGAGDAAVSMRVLWLANGLNIVLAPILIVGVGPVHGLGIRGAAIATTIGRGVGVLYQLVLLARPRGRLVVRRRHLVIDPRTLATLARVASAGVLQSLIGTASWIGLVRIVARDGSAALAGYTVAMRVVMFALLPSWGLANAASTLVGQSLGAGRPERAERAVWTAAAYNAVFLGMVGLVLVAFAVPIVARFAPHDPAMARQGAECLRVVSYGFVFYAVGMVFEQAFNGAGDTWTPTWMNLACFWFGEIPLAYALAGPGRMGARGVYWSIAAAFSVVAVVALALFRRGGWKRSRV